MVARDNYSYKKYQKELAQKKKREAKMQSKLDKKNMEAKVSDDKDSAPAELSDQASNEDVTVVQN